MSVRRYYSKDQQLNWLFSAFNGSHSIHRPYKVLKPEKKTDVRFEGPGGDDIKCA